MNQEDVLGLRQQLNSDLIGSRPDVYSPFEEFPSRA
jgi:hypothetical protein